MSTEGLRHNLMGGIAHELRTPPAVRRGDLKARGQRVEQVHEPANPSRPVGAHIPDGRAVRTRTWAPWLRMPGSIEVHQDEFYGLEPAEQLAILFHEAMHLEFGRHDPNKEIAPNRDDADQSYACERLCFFPESTSQCSCATCLEEVDKCSIHCASLKTCPAGRSVAAGLGVLTGDLTGDLTCQNPQFCFLPLFWPWNAPHETLS